jgi:hypothetical protein
LTTDQFQSSARAVKGTLEDLGFEVKP